MATFGENFRRLQRRARLSGAEAAEAIRAHESQVSQWRRDSKGLPELPTLLRIAKGLRCSIDELLAGVDPEYDAVVNRDLTRPPADPESGASDSGGSPTDEQARQLQQLREEFATYRSAVTMLEEAAESIVALAAKYHHDTDRRPEGRQAPRKKPRRSRPHRKAG